VSHVTKEGLVAGPKVVEHLVDVVLRLEGDNQYDFRLLRALKNRFGPTGEIGVFQMEAAGLVPVEQYDRFFCPSEGPPGPGAATVIVCEGTRSLLVEVQALVTESPWQMPNRRVTGLDPNRVALHLAQLGKHGVPLGRHDVFVNVAGGFRLTEPASDLGSIMAVASSQREIPLPPHVAFVGEVGLRGELRGVHSFQARLKEAAYYGVARVVAPKANETSGSSENLSITYFSELHAVLEHFFGSIASEKQLS
jgi:DNA repair protein RadA/Sms